MSDNDVQVSFGGDASGLQAAAGAAVTSIQSLAPAIATANKGLEQFQKAIEAAFKTPKTDGIEAAAHKAQQSWDKSVTTTLTRFNQGLMQMAEGSKSFSQVMTGVGQQILNHLIEQISKMESAWIKSELTKTATTQAGTQARSAAEEAGHLKARILSFETAEKDILNSAVKAAGGAFNAFASNPLTLPLAPVAAATAFAAVEAFGNLASAAGGYDIPSGVNPLVQAHAEEMILPARIANPLRSMLGQMQGAQTPAFGGAQDGGGASSISLSIHALDGKSVQQFFDKHSDRLVRSLRGAHRRGALSEVFG